MGRRSRRGIKKVSTGVLQQARVGSRAVTRKERVDEIVARCKEGDPVAFRQLFDRYVSGVSRHLNFLVSPGSDLDDLTQLVFLNVFQSIKRFRGHSSFSTWLFRITVNVARQEIRQRSRARRLKRNAGDYFEVVSNGSEKSPEHLLSATQQIYEILDRLPWKKRETFILYTYEGYSLEEISQLLGSSVSTIGSRLQSARKEIIKILAQHRDRR